MAAKDFAEIDTGFPIYGLRFVNNHTLFACGGGGEGANGIPNKVTAVRCSFTVSDKSRRLQKFREITLPSNEDSPMCVEFCRSSTGDNSRYSIFIGCNQSTELIRSMNINNNLRKYNYTDDEHLQFLDAVQFDDSLSVESIGEYPKIVHLSSDSTIGGMMTSRIPSEIFIFNPETLELNIRFKPSSPSEIKDFHLNPIDGGKTLTYITASFIETISTNSGNSIGSSSTTDKKTAKTLGKYFFSKIRYVEGPKVIITAALRSGRGAAVLEYNTETRKVTKEKVISTKIKGIVAIDLSNSSGLCAVAGNDFSVSLLRLSDLKVVKTYTKLHKFAVTCLSFSPDGKKLATGSASNTLSVLLVKPPSGGFFSFLYSLFRFVFFSTLIAVFAFYVQQMHESGELDQYVELSKIYGAKALVHAQHYQEVGIELSQKYGKEYYEMGQHYGKIGFDIAKEQAYKGLEFAREQINERMAAKKESTTTSSMPDWASQGIETTSTVESDMVRQTTRDIHELTRGTGEIDTSSIINEATRVSFSNTVQATASPSTNIEALQDSDDIRSEPVSVAPHSDSSSHNENQFVTSSSPSEIEESTVAMSSTSQIEEPQLEPSLEATIGESVQAETRESIPDQKLEFTANKDEDATPQSSPSSVLETEQVAQENVVAPENVIHEASSEPPVIATELSHVSEAVTSPDQIDTPKFDVDGDIEQLQNGIPSREFIESHKVDVQNQEFESPDQNYVGPIQLPSSIPADYGNYIEESRETRVLEPEESQATEHPYPHQDESFSIASEIVEASEYHPGDNVVDDFVAKEKNVETTNLVVESSFAEPQTSKDTSSAATHENIQSETIETPRASVESNTSHTEHSFFEEHVQHTEHLTVNPETSESSPEPIKASDHTFVETESPETIIVAGSHELPSQEPESHQPDAENTKDDSYVQEVHVAEIPHFERASESEQESIVSAHSSLHIDSDVASTVEMNSPSSEETHAIHDEL